MQNKIYTLLTMLGLPKINAVHAAYGDDLRLGELELQTGKAKDAAARREGRC